MEKQQEMRATAGVVWVVFVLMCLLTRSVLLAGEGTALEIIMTALAR